MSNRLGAPADRVFLDANVLFSAAYREAAGLLRLWKLEGVVLLTSSYAEEARRNLDSREQRGRLNRLVTDLELVSEVPNRGIPEDIDLPEKDQPILQAALGTEATHLLTGDIIHFGGLLGREIEGRRVERPGTYLRRKLEDE